MDTQSAPAPLSGLDDADMHTKSTWASLLMPVRHAGSASLSFGALAKLFAANRPSLIDADLATIETRELLAASSRRGRHLE